MDYHYVHSLSGMSKQVCTKGGACTRSNCKHAHPNVSSTCQHSKWCLQGPLHGSTETPACSDNHCAFNHFVTSDRFTDYRSGDFNRRKHGLIELRGASLIDQTDPTPAETSSINPYKVAEYHQAMYMIWYDHAIACVNANDSAQGTQNFNATWYHYNMFIQWRDRSHSNMQMNLQGIAKTTVTASSIPPANNPWTQHYRKGRRGRGDRVKDTAVARLRLFNDYIVAKKQ